jgi:hypothetical protein
MKIDKIDDGFLLNIFFDDNNLLLMLKLYLDMML